MYFADRGVYAPYVICMATPLICKPSNMLINIIIRHSKDKITVS